MLRCSQAVSVRSQSADPVPWPSAHVGHRDDIDPYPSGDKRNGERKALEVKIANTPATCRLQRREWPSSRAFSDQAAGSINRPEIFATETSLIVIVPSSVKIHFRDGVFVKLDVQRRADPL